MIKSIDELYKIVIGSDTEIHEFKELAYKPYELFQEQVNVALDRFCYTQESLEYSVDSISKISLHDIHISDNQKYYLISVKNFVEDGIIIKEIIIPNNYKYKHLSIESDDDNKEYSQDLAEESEINDESLSYQQVEELNIVYHTMDC